MQRLTGQQLEERLGAEWGRHVYVNAYRLCGNRLTWTAQDHNGHYMNLARGWNGEGETVFWPANGEPWPWQDGQPEEPVDYLGQAYDLARARFRDNPTTLPRLDRALEIARAGDLYDKGKGIWWVGSDLQGLWTVAGLRCNCPDSVYRGRRWCKHSLAVALVLKSQRLQREAEGGSPQPPEAPTSEDPDNGQDTTISPERQAEITEGEARWRDYLDDQQMYRELAQGLG